MWSQFAKHVLFFSNNSSRSKTNLKTYNDGSQPHDDSQCEDLEAPFDRVYDDLTRKNILESLQQKIKQHRGHSD